MTNYGFRSRACAAVALMIMILIAPTVIWGQAPPADRLTVMFLGDEDHHVPYERAKDLMPILGTNGIDMFYSDDPADLATEVLEDYHALILYNNQPSISPDQLAALLGFVEDGGGLVVLHSASAAFQNSEEYIKVVGAAFKSHGTDTFSTVRLEPNHEALMDVPPFESFDETYVHTKHNPINRTVLEVRRDGDHDEPWTWVKPYGSGRVYYTAWGHDERTWSTEGFQKQVVQATRWAAGDWALQRIMPLEPLPTSALPAPLPVYVRPPAPWNTLADEAIREIQTSQPVETTLELTTLRPGFTIDWFAMDPMIRRIIDFTWDDRGRMWALEANDYPNRVLPEGSTEGTDRVLILEDTDGDNRADEATVFADGMNLATSLVIANGGLIVAQAPDILFFTDTDGDDVADTRETIMTGWPRNDTHGTPSNFRYGLDNQILGSVGYNGFEGTVAGRTWSRRDFFAGYFRFPADASGLDYLARTSNNTWGVAQSEDGYIFGSTANGEASIFAPIPGRYYDSIGVPQPTLPKIENRTDLYPIYPEIRQVDWFGMYTSAAAHEIYTARSFPSEYWNRAAFVADPTGHLVGQFDLNRDGSTYRAKNMWSFLSSLDTWLAPVQVKVGPDGALWVSDFYSLVAQHNPTPQIDDNCCDRGPGNAYETPNRDAIEGRIYRIAFDGAPEAEPMSLGNANPGELVAALRDDNMFWRLTAQRLLVERGETDVIPQLVAALDDHTIDDLGLNPGALHALWTLDGLGAVDDAGVLESVRNALYHPAGSVRRAALQVLPRNGQLLEDIFAAGILPDRPADYEVGYSVPASLQQDADAGVRLEALLVLSELAPSGRAAAALMDVLFAPQNARDRWIPDAVALAGASQGRGFLFEVLSHEMPEDEGAMEGIGRAVRVLTHAEAVRADADAVVALIQQTPVLTPILGEAILEGITAGWPADSPPVFGEVQSFALANSREAASPALEESFADLAERWNLPDVFGAP